MKILLMILLTSALLFAGCDQEEQSYKIMPPETREFAREFIERFASDDLETVADQLQSSGNLDEKRFAIKRIAEFFPSDDPLDIKLVEVNRVSWSDSTQYNLTLQYEYPDRWLIVRMLIRPHGESYRVFGFHVTPIPESLAETNKLTLSGKSPAHFLFVFLTIVMPLFTLYALIRCLKTPMPRRKWVWVIFIISAFGQFRLNWSSGATDILPFSFQFFGASFVKAGPLAPMILSISLPVGAFIFLSVRKRWTIADSLPPEETPSNEE